MSNKKINKDVFFIVGAAKSGTSSLNNYLNAHPEIHMCPKKDVACYFCRDYGLPLTFEEYQDMLFFEGDYQVVGDCCHAYLTDEKSAAWIKEKFPQAKIIMILRNPADKAFSQYHWLVSHGYEYIESFEEALKVEESRCARGVWKDHSLIQGYPPNYLYYQSSLYAEQIARYTRYFTDDKILYLTYDKLHQNPSKVMMDIASFLGVNQSIVIPKYKVFNKRRGVKSIRLQYFLVRKASKILPRKVTELFMRLNTIGGESITFCPETRSFLLQRFKSDIEKTSKMTGLDLNHWLEGIK